VKKEHLHNGLKMDSQEEIDFQCWIEEALQAGYLSNVIYHPVPFLITPKQTYTEEKILKTKTKVVGRTLLQPHQYTPDFILDVTEKFLQAFPNHGLRQKNLVYMNANHEIINITNFTYFIDVKGAYSLNDALRRFSVDQKLVYHLHGIFINKVIPAEFFKITWVPKSCAFMSNRRELTRRKPFAECELLSEINRKEK